MGVGPCEELLSKEKKQANRSVIWYKLLRMNRGLKRYILIATWNPKSACSRTSGPMSRTNIFTLIPPLDIYTESKYYSIVEYLSYDKKRVFIYKALLKKCGLSIFWVFCKRSENPLLKLFIYDFLILSPKIHSIPFDGDTLVRGNLQWPARSVGGHVVAFVVPRFDTRTSGNRDLCWCDRTSGHHVLAWESTCLQQLPGRQKASSVKGQGKTEQ